MSMVSVIVAVCTTTLVTVLVDKIVVPASVFN